MTQKHSLTRPKMHAASSPAASLGTQTATTYDLPPLVARSVTNLCRKAAPRAPAHSTIPDFVAGMRVCWGVAFLVPWNVLVVILVLSLTFA